MMTRVNENPGTMPECGPSATLVSIDFDLERAALDVIDANRILREHLLNYDCVIRESLEMHRTGMRIRDVVRTLPPADAAIGSEVEVVGVFEARSALRRILVVALLTDGMPMAEVAATLKIPMTNVCDFANQAGLARE